MTGQIATATGVLSTAIISNSSKKIIREFGDRVGVVSTYIGGATLVVSVVGDWRRKNFE